MELFAKDINARGGAGLIYGILNRAAGADENSSATWKIINGASLLQN